MSCKRLSKLRRKLVVKTLRHIYIYNLFTGGWQINSEVNDSCLIINIHTEYCLPMFL